MDVLFIAYLLQKRRNTLKDFICNAVYRMKTEHRFHFPVQVRSAGRNSFTGKWHETPEVKTFLELFWCLSGEFEFTSGILHKNEVCCYFPGDLHKVIPMGKGEFYWITFDGNELEYLISRVGLKREPYYAGTCPSHLFEQIMKGLRCTGELNEWRIGCLGYEILTRSAIPVTREIGTLSSQFCQLVALHLSNSDFSISTAAHLLHVHRSTLMRQMAEDYGMSPQKYLTSCRIQQAEALLKNTPLLIKEIAEQSGFSDPNYFCRMFRNQYGISPLQFREDHDQHSDDDN